MTRKLNAALLAVALISQPRYMRADGEDVVAKVAAGVVGIGLIWWALQPDSDETVINKARNLVDTVRQHPRVVGDSEFDRQNFAQGLQGSVEDTQREFLRERAAIRDLTDNILSRLAKPGSDMRLIALHDCARELNASLDALNIKHAYLNQHAEYFKLYKANERARALIQRGCPSGYNNSCAQDFRHVMDDIERFMNPNYRQEGTNLFSRVERDTYPQLVRKYGDINKQIENERRHKQTRDMAMNAVGVVAGALWEASTQQQSAAQLEQAAVEQAKRNSKVTHDQEEMLRQAKAQQERKRSEDAAMQQALLNDAKTQQREHAKCTYGSCDKGSGPECPAYQKHRDCTPERCARGLSQHVCPAQELYHAKCTHDTCYKGSAGQCPAYQIHRNCNNIWCNYHQDAWCPRFHNRSSLNH
jgi:hypothetical protein